MVGVGNQADNDIDFGDFSVERLIVVDIELQELAHEWLQWKEGGSHADGFRVRDALGQCLCLLESSARYSMSGKYFAHVENGQHTNNNLDTRLSENFCSWASACTVSLSSNCASS